MRRNLRCGSRSPEWRWAKVCGPNKKIAQQNAARDAIAVYSKELHSIHRAKEHETMNWFLTDEQQMIVDTAREIAQKKILPVREKYDHDGIFPWDVVKALRRGRSVRTLYSRTNTAGSAAACSNYVLRLKNFRKFAAAFRLPWPPRRWARFRFFFSAPMNRKRNISPVSPSGKKLAAFGLTEANAGSDALGMKTTAVFERRPLGT